MLRAWILATVFLCAACDSRQAPQNAESISTGAPPDILATNAFYYYEDVDVAWRFYKDTLGLETVVDYGFAKIMRLADTSYLTLVRAAEGMHSADEPKTVTLSLVTDTLQPWYIHLSEAAVPMRVAYDAEAPGNHFVALDPGGYLLKFVRYNPHASHEAHIDSFAESDPVSAQVPGSPSIRATAFSVYFDDVYEVTDFYESLFGRSVSGMLGGQPLYRIAGSGYVSLVNGSDGLLSPTEKSGVTLSFLTTDINGWFDRATAWPGFELRTPEILSEGGLVDVFVGYDPAGTFLEWDTFLDLEDNATLIKYLTN